MGSVVGSGVVLFYYFVDAGCSSAWSSGSDAKPTPTPTLGAKTTYRALALPLRNQPRHFTTRALLLCLHTKVCNSFNEPAASVRSLPSLSSSRLLSRSRRFCPPPAAPASSSSTHATHPQNPTSPMPPSLPRLSRRCWTGGAHRAAVGVERSVLPGRVRRPPGRRRDGHRQARLRQGHGQEGGARAAGAGGLGQRRCVSLDPLGPPFA